MSLCIITNFDYRQLLRGVVCLCMLAVITVPNAIAQHSIDIEQRAAQGSFLDALELFQKMPKRQLTSNAIDAAASSAQALSLNVLASTLIETALLDQKLTPYERASLLIRKGVIEFQEERFAVAKMFGTRAETMLESPSVLRAQAILLSARADDAMGNYSQAELGYLNALTEVGPEDIPDVYFLVSGVQLKLQKNAEARSSLEQIPLSSPHAAEAMLRLAELSVAEQQPRVALLLIDKGNALFPHMFNTGKAQYLALRAAVALANGDRVKQISTDFTSRYPPSDMWRTLIEATSEHYLARSGGRL